MEATRRDPAEDGAAAARRDARDARNSATRPAQVCKCEPPCEYAEGEINDDHCEHGVSVDDHHGCAECAAERADFMLDQQREGVL
jgi:hypothetical protein